MDAPQVGPLALVISRSDAEREKACRTLAEGGYETVGFSDCVNACAWLEEETPVVAVVSADDFDQCEAAIATLQGRGTDIRRTATCSERSKPI